MFTDRNNRKESEKLVETIIKEHQQKTEYQIREFREHVDIPAAVKINQYIINKQL